MTLKTTDFVGSFAKGLRVIEAFTSDAPRRSISEVAGDTGLDRATTRRSLLTLAELGYADYDGKYFTLTPKVLRLGTGCLAAMPLPRIVQPFLDELSAAIGQSTSVSILDGDEIVYVARAAQQRLMSINLMPGSRLPAYCTSMGRVLLAALEREDAFIRLKRQPLPARTAKTITSVGAIMALLEKTRADGYAIIDQEVEMGLRSIAVPLFNARGQTIAALNVGVATIHADPSELRSIYLERLIGVQSALRANLR